MKYYAIIVGGGSGSRMQAGIPKQFLPLNGRPVLMHTIEAFISSKFKPEIIVVLNVEFLQYWEDLCAKHQFEVPHRLISGGQQRFHSVKKGLKEVKGAAVVAIHDAVRPLVTSDIIDSAYLQAGEIGTAVTAIKSRDSVRQQSGSSTIALNRDDIFIVQTPQVFRSDILAKAYRQEFRNEFTDDASVVERSGQPIEVVQGSSANIKITYPEDIVYAELLLKKMKPHQDH